MELEASVGRDQGWSNKHFWVKLSSQRVHSPCCVVAVRILAQCFCAGSSKLEPGYLGRAGWPWTHRPLGIEALWVEACEEGAEDRAWEGSRCSHSETIFSLLIVLRD